MKSDARVAVLTNCVPAYRAPLLEALSGMVKQLRVFVSVKVVPGRDWHLFLDHLDVVVNRTFMRKQEFQNVHGFADISYLDIPWDAVWVLAKYRPDVVISAEFGLRTLFCCLYKMLFPRTKLIVWATLSERTESTRGGRRVAVRRRVLRLIDAIFVNGHSGERYVRSLGFANKPLAYVNQTIDNTAFLGPATRPAGPLRLFFVGQIVERKGLYPFLTQLCRWCETHSGTRVEVIIAGDGPELERLKSIAPPANLTIDFPGVAKFQQLPGYYHTADISIFPTLADEWGVVVNEAMIAGLPILASRHSQAVEELVQDGVNGWVFDPTDSEDMYRAIDRALTTDRAGLDAMRQPAIDAIASLTPQIVADRMLVVIRELHGS